MNTKLAHKEVADLPAPQARSAQPALWQLALFVFKRCPKSRNRLTPSANHRLRLRSEIRRHGLHARAR
jgi:hypothetical protein